MAYAEAIAHGVPVVGTNAGAIPDTIPSAAGVLVPPDDVEALAAALHDLWKDAGKRARLGDAGFRGVREHYSIERSTNQLMSVYEEMC